MSHKQTNPRQSNAGRKVVTTPAIPSSPARVKRNPANAAINKTLRCNMHASPKLTPGQAAALQASGSKTY